MSEEQPPLGHCSRVVDEGEELVCGKVAAAEVLVRNRFGLFAVGLCFTCLAEHKRFYRGRRSRGRGRPLAMNSISASTPAVPRQLPHSIPGSNSA